MPSFPKSLFGGPLCSLYPQRLSLSHETDQDHVRERNNSVHTPKPSKEHSLLEVEWSCFQVQGQHDFLRCCDSGSRLSRTCTARQPEPAAAVGLICYPMHFLDCEVYLEGSPQWIPSMERIRTLFFIFKPRYLCPIPQLSRPFPFAFFIDLWPETDLEKENLKLVSSQSLESIMLRVIFYN